MRRSDTSRACAFSAAVTVLAPRPRAEPESCGLRELMFWMFVSGALVVGVCVFWVLVSGGAKCLLDSAGGRPAPGGPGDSLRCRGYQITEVTSI